MNITVETKETDTEPICRTDQTEKKVKHKEVKVPSKSPKEVDPNESETISKKKIIDCILVRNNHCEEDWMEYEETTEETNLRLEEFLLSGGLW